MGLIYVSSLLLRFFFSPECGADVILLQRVVRLFIFFDSQRVVRLGSSSSIHNEWCGWGWVRSSSIHAVNLAALRACLVGRLQPPNVCLQGSDPYGASAFAA
ncbi:hypothetical protein RIF29_37929 [Crotalaria pallida]|uniref:Secreted protein n=1 Tax=Crotalaria pallida TaxID=3830 RepID=A0AAN9E4P3_CROPI